MHGIVHLFTMLHVDKSFTHAPMRVLAWLGLFKQLCLRKKDKLRVNTITFNDILVQIGLIAIVQYNYSLTSLNRRHLVYHNLLSQLDCISKEVLLIYATLLIKQSVFCLSLVKIVQSSVRCKRNSALWTF